MSYTGYYCTKVNYSLTHYGVQVYYQQTTFSLYPMSFVEHRLSFIRSNGHVKYC